MPLRVALDTCVVRNFIEQRNDQPDLHALAAASGQVLVSIADSAFGELVSQLLEGRLPFDAWTARIHQLNAVLVAALPILPSGNELAAMAGIGSTPYSEPDTQAFSQAAWGLLLNAKSVGDLASGGSFTDSTGTHLLKADAASVAKILDGYRTRWSASIKRIVGLAKEDSPAAIEQVLLTELQPRPTDPPDFAKKLDAVARCLAQFVNMARSKGSPYNPDNPRRRGDVFDFELLYALPLPAIVCTADHKFCNRVRTLKSAQTSQIVLVDELNHHLANGTLASLVAH